MSLGPPIRKPPPEPPKEQWRPVEGKPWLEVNQRGQMRTTDWKPPPR
jgi:hypothetical protein